MLITTSLSDSRVLFDEPTKYCARLRDLKTDNNLLLLKCEMDAGHGGKSGRTAAIEEIAFDYAFALKIVQKKLNIVPKIFAKFIPVNVVIVFKPVGLVTLISPIN